MVSPLLSCEALSKCYQAELGPVRALRPINFSVFAGERVGIVGPSGSGKSTLLHLLGGLDEPSTGRVLFEGMDVHRLSSGQQAKLLNQAIGFVHQFHHLLPDFTALENVQLPLLIAGQSRRVAAQRAHSLIEAVGLSLKAAQLPATLSGGEKQRVAIARALANRPKLILADEPTGNLDPETSRQIIGLFRTINQTDNTTFLLITHDPKIAASCSRVLCLESGQLITDA